MVTRAAGAAARASGAFVERLVIARAMTALDMRGFSVTALRLPTRRDARSSRLRDEALTWIDRAKDVACPALRAADLSAFDATDGAGPAAQGESPAEAAAAALRAAFDSAAPAAADRATAAAVFHALRAVAAALVTEERRLNELDAAVGDGDTGSGAARAASLLLGSIPPDVAARAALPAVPAALLLAGEVVADAFAGTGGPLLGAAIASAAAEPTLVAAVATALAAVQGIGHAAVGDRTMVDALAPMAAAAAASADAGHTTAATLRAVVAAAEGGAATAAALRARRGRARYQGGAEVGKPDPGCELLVAIARAAAAAVTDAA